MAASTSAASNVEGDTVPPPPLLPHRNLHIGLPRSPAAVRSPVVLALRFPAASSESAAEIHGFTIATKLGAGRFGKVYSVRRGSDVFAMKVCERQKLATLICSSPAAALLSRDADADALASPRYTEYDALCQEIRLLRRLEHPGIVRVVDAFETPSKTCMVMELLDHPLLVEGDVVGTFVCPLTRTPLSESRAKAYMRGILQALQYLHDAGIAHGDLKPENVMMRPAGSSYVPVLVDFGKAVRTETVDGGLHWQGTPAFCPPEACCGTFADAKAADVWTAGVTLYCMVQGRLPFSVEHGHALLDDAEGSTPSYVALKRSILSGQWDRSIVCPPEAPAGAGDAIPASAAMLSLLDGLLHAEPRSRLTAASALKHPWLDAE